MSITATKWCPRGQHHVPRSEFSRDGRRADGLQSWCNECRRTYKAGWRADNPDKTRQHRRTYESKNRAKIRVYQRTYMDRLRDEVFAAYGNACACCGEDQREFLTLDHVGGREGAHVGATTLSVYLMVRKEGFPREPYRLLCWNCNMAHGLYGYCPHEGATEEAVA